MNQLIRGVERSGSLLRASRRSYSAVATAVGGGIYSYENVIVPASSLLLRRNVEPTLVSVSHVADRNLSSMHAATTATIGEDESTVIQRPPSALEQATLEEITPGHAIFVLQKFASEANGNKLIRQSDFVMLCDSARPGKMRDAKVIATAMKEFKRCNRFVLQSVGSKAAVDGILRSMTPTWKVQDGKPRVRAALFAAEQIVDETTGLYFAVETATVDKVLEELHKGLLEMQENRMKVTIDNINDETVEGEDIRSDVKLAKEALRLTGDMINQLIKRRSRPEREMNKRRKNLYLKRLQIGSGPRRSTLQLGTKISLLIGGTSAAQTNIIEPFEAAWWTSFVDEDALQLIADAVELERQMPVSAIAATVDDVREDESKEIEDADETAGGEKDADDVELNEVDESKQEEVAEVGEEKK